MVLPHLLPLHARKRVNLAALREIKIMLRQQGLNTICEEARCPNIEDCFRTFTATFLLLGDTCSRRCSFCNVQKGKPGVINEHEPEMVAASAEAMRLRHVVLTSVTRDDLEDGGALQFYRTAEAIKDRIPGATVEFLTPDFKGKERALEIISGSKMDVFGHNMETVKSLYPEVRQGGDYERSLDVIKFVQKRRSDVIIKSGFMLGIGEGSEEVKDLMTDLRKAGCQIVTIGQYLRPALEQVPVRRFLSLEEFAFYKKMGEEMGFLRVLSGPLIRSSYQAGSLLKEVRAG